MNEDRKSKDVELWSAWSKNPNKTTLTPLLKQVDPVINKEVSRWVGGPVAMPALRAQARQLAVKSFETFDPRKAALNTHLTNQLKSLSRDVYTYSGPARMPEHRKIKMKTFNDSLERLKDDLAREPSVEELADDLSWSPAEVARFRKEQRRELSDSLPVSHGFSLDDDDDSIVSFVYHDLNPSDKVVFEHTTGYGGAQVLSTRDLMAKSGLTSGQISHSKRRLKSIISGVVR